jgi:hypothetical protein
VTGGVDRVPAEVLIGELKLMTTLVDTFVGVVLMNVEEPLIELPEVIAVVLAVAERVDTGEVLECDVPMVQEALDDH